MTIAATKTSNWLQVLEQQASLHSEKIALTELSAQTGATTHISYQELSLRAKALAFDISSHSQFGDRVILLMPSGIDYVVSFFACIYAGVQAVEKWLQRALYQGFYSKITHLPVYWCE